MHPYLSTIIGKGESKVLQLYGYLGEKTFTAKDGTPFKKYYYEFLDRSRKLIVHYATYYQHIHLQQIQEKTFVDVEHSQYKQNKFSFKETPKPLNWDSDF